MRRRAAPYQSAMDQALDARRYEFERPLALSGMSDGMCLLEFPSGGGCLRRYLPPCVDYLSAETATDYAAYADVATGSAPATWLGEFVGTQRAEGYVAMFLDEHDERQIFSGAGFRVTDCPTGHYPWLFCSRQQTIDFSRDLFRLDRADDELIWQVLNDCLCTRIAADGAVELNWSLTLGKAV